MTVSPAGHEHYFEKLVKLVASSNPPDADAIAALRSRYDTEQLSALKRTEGPSLAGDATGTHAAADPKQYNSILPP